MIYSFFFSFLMQDINMYASLCQDVLYKNMYKGVIINQFLQLPWRQETLKLERQNSNVAS